MAIPAIAPYTLPTEAELPENKVTWRPDPRRAVLLVHDMQNYFLAPFTRGAPPLGEVIENIALLTRHCAELGVPVIYSAQPGGQAPEDRGLLTDFWGPGLAADPEATAIVDALAPGDPSAVLTKWRYSAFVRTDLAERMAGRDQLVITGVYAHIGVQATATDAFMRDIQTFVVADAVADFSAAHHRDALAYVAQRCAALTTTHRLADDLLGVMK
ncbi:isochorismatase family protein [Bailinhaonella thermotolerans]|uniref:Isochorismatase family protein n=1 Tax=Bailinhaonella thermotolerans TaxID=1070861 RepID=A0A3A4AYB3_9ACTN|nr:isochorismatase family protein [Bailinhaonella thermotolerans]RJL30833.1 isochorismatase family protein [Bailinhaonella thermotolerans]